MSYCRWSEGDVYMFPSGNSIICMCCSLGYVTERERHNCEDVVLNTPQGALDHLQQHRDAGDIVPDCAFEQLRAEAQQ